MKQTEIAGIALAAALALSSAVFAQAPKPSDAPGWTGMTHAKDIIAARFGLMVEVERLMQPIDSYTIGEPAEPAALRSAAETVSCMLRALPHLFPPTTDLYDPAAETPATIALPAIWQDFDTFYALADSSAQAAERMAAMADPEALRAGALELRSTCDACHALYLRAYAGPEISTDDFDFDFDSVLPGN
jgi:cytochrome c556